MDRVSGLTDDILIKILSFLPTKDAVSTCILSRRWKFLWLWLPKLEYIGRHNLESSLENLDRTLDESLLSFLDRAMPLHKAPVIESFRIDLHLWSLKPNKGVTMWIVIALSRYLRELDISYTDYSALDMRNILPSSLYSCSSLVTLKLCGHFPVDVPSTAALPSLKTLQLERVTDLLGETLRRLLSVCSFLENLLVELSDCHDMGNITVIVPSLLSLSLVLPFESDLDVVEIKAPSLRYFRLEDRTTETHTFAIENMPKLEEAYVAISSPNVKSLIGVITSVKRLTICLEDVYGNGFVFNQLEHLKLCDCGPYSSKNLVQLLEDSPNLQELDVFKMEHGVSEIDYYCQPKTVPKSFMSSLQTFKWSGYMGRTQDVSVAVYILQNALCLKSATFSCDEELTPKFEMLQKLALSPRASTSFQLIFS